MLAIRNESAEAYMSRCRAFFFEYERVFTEMHSAEQEFEITDVLQADRYYRD